MPVFWVRRWCSCISFLLNSFPNKITMISVWELLSLCLSWLAAWKEPSHNLRKTASWSRQWNSLTSLSLLRLIFLYLLRLSQIYFLPAKCLLLWYQNLKIFLQMSWKRQHFNLINHLSKKLFNSMTLLMSDLESCWLVNQEVVKAAAIKCWLKVLPQWKLTTKSLDSTPPPIESWTRSQFPWAKCMVKWTPTHKNGRMVLQVRSSEMLTLSK